MCLVGANITVVSAKVEGNIPRKRGAASAGYDKALDCFFDKVLVLNRAAVSSLFMVLSRSPMDELARPGMDAVSSVPQISAGQVGSPVYERAPSVSVSAACSDHTSGQAVLSEGSISRSKVRSSTKRMCTAGAAGDSAARGLGDRQVPGHRRTGIRQGQVSRVPECGGRQAGAQVRCSFLFPDRFVVVRETRKPALSLSVAC